MRILQWRTKCTLRFNLLDELMDWIGLDRVKRQYFPRISREVGREAFRMKMRLVVARSSHNHVATTRFSQVQDPPHSLTPFSRRVSSKPDFHATSSANIVVRICAPN